MAPVIRSESKSRSLGFGYKPDCVPKRYTVTLLAAIGYMLLLALRTNLSITLISMTSDRIVTVSENRTVIEKAEFNWDFKTRGFLLSTFNMGHIFAFLTGFFLQRIGGAKLFGCSAAVSSILSILTPSTLRTSVAMFMCLRVFQGFVQALAAVSIVDIFTHWAPPGERSRLLSYCYTGPTMGTALNYQICGFILESFTWPVPFYTSGVCTLLWALIWLFYVGDDPSTDRFISEEERSYLKSEIHISTQKLPVPWKSFFCSAPIYVLMNFALTFDWVHSFLMYISPLYIQDVYKIDIKSVGLISSLPLWFAFIMNPTSGVIGDYLRSNIFSVSKVHKIYVFIGQVMAGSFLILVAAVYSGHFLLSTISFCLLMVAASFGNNSYWTICIDLGGQFSGALKGLTYTFTNVGNLISPILMGYMIRNQTLEEWKLYLYVISIITLYGGVVFIFFGSGELQPWAIPPKEAVDNGNKLVELERQRNGRDSTESKFDCTATTLSN